MNTKIKARLEQLTADIEIIDGAIELSHRLMKDLNEGRIVRLTKANDSAIVLQHGNDIDEFDNYIYRFTIEPADLEPTLKNLPVNLEDMLDFLFGEEFATYGIVEK